MTISSCDKEIKELIDNKSVVGLESILNAIVRATDGKAWMSKEDVFRYLEDSYRMEQYWKIVDYIVKNPDFGDYQ